MRRSLLLLVTGIALSGCLSRPALVKQSFTLSTAPAPARPGPSQGRVLGIRRLSIAAPFDSQSFNYRTGEFSYERDPYAQFLVPPAETLSDPLRELLRQSGVLAAVTEPGSALRANTLLEIHVGQLYGDFRNRADPAAVLSARLIFYDAPNGMPGRVLLQKEYSRRLRLPARTAAALVKGWNQAWQQIVTEAASDFSAAIH
jgi:cholesterol transport system auxiliary component